jgi:hypothetical protein
MTRLGSIRAPPFGDEWSPLSSQQSEALALPAHLLDLLCRGPFGALAHNAVVDVDGPRPSAELVPSPPGPEVRSSSASGAHLGHDPRDSNGQSRSLTDPSARRFTCAKAVDLHLVRDHTVYGMQEVTHRCSTLGCVVVVLAG